MAENHFSRKVKTLRTAKAMSQEELAEKTCLSLRTIQRIENNETEPRGDALKRLAQALQTTTDEVIEWRLEEDRRGIFITIVFWTLKKDKIQAIDRLGKEIFFL